MNFTEGVTELAGARSALAILTLNPHTGEINVIRNSSSGDECVYVTEEGRQMYGTATADDTGDTIFGDDAVHVVLDKEGLFAQLQSGDTDDDGEPTPKALEGIAEGLSKEWELVLAQASAEQATEVQTKATAAADRATADRAVAIDRLVKACGGNQSQAARRLGMDQSTVNKILKRAGLA